MSDLNSPQDSLLKDSKVFCMLPWVHLHSWPSGDVFPCCMMEKKEDSIGNLNQETLLEVWNSDRLKLLRRNMLEGNKTKSCGRCYEGEAFGRSTLRQYANKKYSSDFEVVKKTEDAGSLAKLNLKYWDFRLTNLCNFKCRTCGPDLSSSWHEEYLKLNAVKAGKSKVLTLNPSRDIWGQISSSFDEVEEIYFAGGEPLIDDNHYRVLAELQKRNRTNVRLIYSTNLSKLSHRSQNVLEIWKKFPNVMINASIDGSEQKGEYIRKGMVWKNLVKNIQSVKSETPHVEFFVHPTLSVFNAFHLPHLHRELVTLKLIKKHQLVINLLNGPPEFRIDIFTRRMKKRLAAQYREHVAYFLREDACSQVASGFLGAIDFANAKSNLRGRYKFNIHTDAVDRLRGESVYLAIPELIPLRINWIFLYRAAKDNYFDSKKQFIEYLDDRFAGSMVVIKKFLKIFAWPWIDIDFLWPLKKGYYFSRYQVQKRILKNL